MIGDRRVDVDGRCGDEERVMKMNDLEVVQFGEYGWCLLQPLDPGDAIRLVHYDDDDYWCSNGRDDERDHECGDINCDVIDPSKDCYLDNGAIVHATDTCNGMCETVPHESLLKLPDVFSFDVRNDRAGYVYCVAMVPDVDMCRLKIGYTTNPSSRLKAFRTPNPTALLVGLWDADPHDEDRALAVLEGRIGASEVFQVRDFAGALVDLNAAMKRKP